VITPQAPLTLGLGTEPVKQLLPRELALGRYGRTAGQEFPVRKGFAWPATGTERHCSACNFQAKLSDFKSFAKALQRFRHHHKLIAPLFPMGWQRPDG
jgi:hypothetical protein